LVECRISDQILFNFNKIFSIINSNDLDLMDSAGTFIY